MGEIRSGSSRGPLVVFNRLTRTELKKAWHGLKSIVRLTVGTAGEPIPHSEDWEHIKSVINDCIYAVGGEVSARSRAVDLGTSFLNLSEEGRLKFYGILAHDFDVDRRVLEQKIEVLKRAETYEDKIKGEIELKTALVPPRSRLLKQFNSLPNGIKFLIDMRADLMSKTGDDPYLYKLSLDIKEILSSWFDVGLLDLKEITWNSPAALLEKLIEYEAVHEIRSWDDLSKRFATDRLCFAFFHNKMPEEPLIFVEVALVDGLSDNIQELLDKAGRKTGDDEANTAIFYSITNAQQGLAGIHLGNFLIKSVVEKLSAERSSIRNFATLSPVPGFRAWLHSKLEEEGEDILTQDETKTIRSHYACADSSAQLKEILADGWENDELRSRFLEPVLLRLCARYLVKEKKENRALDPVAHFHLNNGASLERLNWRANVSEDGMSHSYGIMVNYCYRLSEIEENHEKYLTGHEVTVGREVKGLLRKG